MEWILGGSFSKASVKEAHSLFDFRAFIRPNGSIYGTDGVCRKGTETALSDEEKADVEKHNARMQGIIDQGADNYLREYATNYHVKAEVALFKGFLALGAKALREGGPKALAAVFSQKQGVDVLRHGMNNQTRFITKEASKEIYDKQTGKKPGEVSRIEHAYPVKKIRDELFPKAEKMTDEELIKSVVPRSITTQVFLNEDKRLSDSKLGANLPPGANGTMARYNHVGIKIYPVRFTEKPSTKHGIVSLLPADTSVFLSNAAKQGIPFETAWKDLIMDGYSD